MAYVGKKKTVSKTQQLIEAAMGPRNIEGWRVVGVIDNAERGSDARRTLRGCIEWLGGRVLSDREDGHPISAERSEALRLLARELRARGGDMEPTIARILDDVRGPRPRQLLPELTEVSA